MQMKKILTLLALTAISIFNALAISPYQKAVNNFVSDPTLKHASIGVCVMDLETGEILADADAEKTFVTASTMKIITSASALEILGKDFHFHTMVYAVGKIDDEGTLHGNLIIQGGGDPTLGSRHFKEHPAFVDSLAVAINAEGIRHINGRIIADKSTIACFPVSQYWMLEDIPASYGTGYHAINFADNQMKVSFTRDFNGRYSVSTTPDMPWINIAADVNEIDKGDTTSTLGITSFLDYPSSTLNLSGNTRLRRGQKGFHRWYANPAPDKLLIDSIISAMTEANIPIAYKNYKKSELADTTLILDFMSPALPDIVKSLMFRSDNLFAEAVLKAIAMDAEKAVTDYNSIKILNKYWNEKGVDLSGLLMKDGCGLARNGCATPLLLYGEDYFAGAPAAAVHPYGQGRAYYLASRFTPNCVLRISTAWARWMRSFPTVIHEMRCPRNVSKYSFDACSLVITNKGRPSALLPGQRSEPFESIATVYPLAPSMAL